MGKQYLNGVLYGTGEIIKFSPEIYSFEEREVGVWTDGKPLYQKSFLIPASTTTGDNTFTTPLGLQNVDKVVDYNAVISPTSVIGIVRFAKLPLALGTKDISTQNGYSFNLQYYDKTTDTLRIDIGSQTSHQGGYGTIWYTKTTDVPGSGHYTTNGGEAHHYSTEEQVVGTWLDGKTLYEKTVDCGALPNNGTKNVNHNIANLKRIINFSGCAYRSVGDIVNIPLPYVGNNSNLNTVLYVGSTIIGITTFSDRSAFTESYVTLQYTKTTD